MPAELRSVTVHIDTGRWSETVLTEVSFEVPAGCITDLLGGPGAGKTMITYVLTDRLPVTAQITGEVLIEGTVGYIPQDGIDAFVPDRTVGEQLRELEQPQGKRTGARACEAVYYPVDALASLPKHHSAGQIQCATLAAALLVAPDVLIADGPTASLDRGTAFGVWTSLRECADSGTALLAVTGDVPMLTATGYADLIAIVEAGRLLATGPWRN
ncbi:ATP-binding cassette domain-containing protein [Rhodococcus pyridinivorans]|nr:ATP-binding cassette domain-containing protein [Rhodococcus pyridinivorans]